MEHDYNADRLSLSDLEEALPRVSSIVSKTEKSQMKYDAKSTPYRRLEPIGVIDK